MRTGQWPDSVGVEEPRLSHRQRHGPVGLPAQPPAGVGRRWGGRTGPGASHRPGSPRSGRCVERCGHGEAEGVPEPRQIVGRGVVAAAGPRRRGGGLMSLGSHPTMTPPRDGLWWSVRRRTVRGLVRLAGRGSSSRLGRPVMHPHSSRLWPGSGCPGLQAGPPLAPGFAVTPPARGEESGTRMAPNRTARPDPPAVSGTWAQSGFCRPRAADAPE